MPANDQPEDLNSSIIEHYQGPDLLGRLMASLVEDGVDPTMPTLADLAPYDHFHGRGLEATIGLADCVNVTPNDHILDMGAGMGGPARYMANRFQCRVTGIDLTAAFCATAKSLNKLLAMEHNVLIQQGNVLDMPFADRSFDGAYSMNVSMNIADKAGFYRETSRVLKPGAWLFLSEIARGEAGAIDYPTPWAETAASSFLASPDDTIAALEQTGFIEVSLRDTRREALAYAAQSRAMVKRGEKPPHRAVNLVHGEIARDASTNSARALRNGAILPIEVSCRKPV